MKDGDRQAERQLRIPSASLHQHGGTRSGAGRPNKYDLEVKIEIGYACEKLWREASEATGEARLASIKHAAEIRARHEAVSHIPVHERKAWLESEAYQEHRGDIEALLHDRAETPFDDHSAEYESDAPRLVTISTKPPRGTRKRIIETVATESGLSKNAVDNLWQAFRRATQELRNSAET